MISDEFYIALGKVAHAAALTENEIKRAILIISGYSESYVMTAHMGIQGCLDVLLTLVNIKEDLPDEEKYKFKRIVGKIKKLNKARNNLLHNPVFYDEAKKRTYLVEMTARGRFNAQFVYPSVESLGSLIMDYSSNYEEFGKLLDDNFPPEP